jgi:hypothetical protein
MGAYQIDLQAYQQVKLGAVYELPSGLYVQVLEPAYGGLMVQAVSVRDMQTLAHGLMVLTAAFIYEHGCLCWTARQWAQRKVDVAAEMEAVRTLREKREMAAYLDVDRAKIIDAEFAAKKVAEIAERAANRQIMRLVA